MVELIGLEVREFEWLFFSARGTDHATKWPRRQAGRAEQIPIAALRAGFRDVEKTELRFAEAVGATVFDLCVVTEGARFDQLSCVRLEEGFWEK